MSYGTGVILRALLFVSLVGAVTGTPATGRLPGVAAAPGCSLPRTSEGRVSTAQTMHTRVGDIRVHKTFHSKILNNDREVVVYLPPDYESDRRKRYSVLYLNDGQNLFDGATSFIAGQEWRVDETAQSLISARQIEPLIIVGIYNTAIASTSTRLRKTKDLKVVKPICTVGC